MIICASAILPADAVMVRGKTGEHQGRFFCPKCGSPVFGRFGDEVGVNLGALNEVDRFKPTNELWTVRREAWLPEFEGVKGYEGDRLGEGRAE